MTWRRNLSHRGKNCKSYCALVREINDAIVRADSALQHCITKTNLDFRGFVNSIRELIENAVPIPADRSDVWLALHSNTNWAAHGEKDARHPHTEVNEDHCDRMVELFEAFAEEYIKMRNALRDAVPNLEKVVAEAADDVEALDKALAVAKKADVADDHDAVQRGQRARAAAAKKKALLFTNCVKELSGEENPWIAEASIFHIYKKNGHTDRDALKRSKSYAIQIGLVQKGDGSRHNYIRLTGVEEADEIETVDGGSSEDGGDAANPQDF